ncbi:MAG: UDP-N-acetylmuramyl-tripeptide synthetase [Patescibacteria group bacterium]
MHELKKMLVAALPAPILSAYHFLLATLAALLARFPSRYIIVVGVTGTKGKSSTIEFLNAIFEAAGWKTALSSTIRFKVGDESRPNLKRMTVPGRFFIQNFLARAVDANCQIAFIELTSESARQHRHRFIDLDALLFVNLAPEHIESHGSLQAYSDAKFELGKQLARSRKRPRYIVANAEDPESGRYLTLPVEHILPFSLAAATPYEARERGGFFTLAGERMEIALPGAFSLKNALAAATLANAMRIPLHTIRMGLAQLTRIPGRAEEIDEGQGFTVVVDYAHTPDSLRAIYGAYPRRKICVIGATGGGRDTWKRPVMGAVAEAACDTVILTNEDPYDEDPHAIVEMLASGMKEKKPEIIMDRREAIRRGLSLARPNEVVLITGKGTDPTMQGPRGSSVPWSDAGVAREELRRLLGTKPTSA